MKIVMKALYTILFIVSALQSISVEATAIHIANQDAFNEEVKNAKRLVTFIVDPAQIKGSLDQIFDNLSRILDILSNDHTYTLSRIGFATVDFGNLAPDTRTELLTALGGKLVAPVTIVLFDSGSVIMADKMPITETDVLEKEEDIAHEITAAIEHAWSSDIDRAIEKCDHADCSRRLAEQQKGTLTTDYKNVEQKARKIVQVSPKQVSEARVYTTRSTRPVYTYYTTPSYDYSSYGQPAYYTHPTYNYDEDYSPYYEYPYYGGYSYGYPYFGVGFGRGSRSRCHRGGHCRFGGGFYVDGR